MASLAKAHPKDSDLEEIPSHIRDLLLYLSQPEEKANEDLAIRYFRQIGGDSFIRQKEAHKADGYVPGSWVLELKGRTNDWLSGFFQGLAYKNQGLDFSQIVVAANDFLVLWQVDDIDEDIREELIHATGAPNFIGTAYAKKYRSRRAAIRSKATWDGGAELSGTLFQAQAALILGMVRSFERAVCEGRKVRLRVTPRNFASVLTEMKSFFDPAKPVKTVRAFYSMVYSWNDSSTVQLSEKNNDQAALGGEVITDLVPVKRRQFKDFVEDRYIQLSPSENVDDFFARYDEALDAVDKDFRIRHGIFFTDHDLSKFVMWLVKSSLSDEGLPELGKNYIVIDPACGSGNLVTNWRSPLELRHKVVSEIEPELLFAIERRMKGDQWHNGRFTVIPKVSENKGLNFLDCSAEDYLRTLREYLREKGMKPDKPLAFLCNPPYRNDDDQGTDAISYKVHESIVRVTGHDASSERYCCFLAQMKRICDVAESKGFPDDTLLLIFTKSAWLTRRPVFERIRAQMLGSFDNVTGVLVKANEFFDVKGSWPVAFTVWRYRPKGRKLNSRRSIPLLDLTWLTKNQLAQIPWDNRKETDMACCALLKRSDEVRIGVERTSIRQWSGQLMTDFKRDRRKDERNAKIVGGLPLNDKRHCLKKAYGSANGTFIGFMDELTPCRVKRSTPDRPWFYLDARFMSIKKARCLSGPPTHLGYCAVDLDSAKKLFFWYTLAKTFLQHPYPMWIDADNMWEPHVPSRLASVVFQTAFAVGFAENECIQTRFPANNPLPGLPELTISNPMTPLTESFWTQALRPYCDNNPPAIVTSLIGAVDKLYCDWKKLFKKQVELPLSVRPYALDTQGVHLGAGMIQIRAYADDANDATLLADLSVIAELLSTAKTEFYDMLTSATGLNYFGIRKKHVISVGSAALVDRESIV